MTTHSAEPLLLQEPVDVARKKIAKRKDSLQCSLCSSPEVALPHTENISSVLSVESIPRDCFCNWKRSLANTFFLFSSKPTRCHIESVVDTALSRSLQSRSQSSALHPQTQNASSKYAHQQPTDFGKRGLRANRAAYHV